jgi:hypothetical protein
MEMSTEELVALLESAFPFEAVYAAYESSGEIEEPWVLVVEMGTLYSPSAPQLGYLCATLCRLWQSDPGEFSIALEFMHERVALGRQYCLNRYSLSNVEKVIGREMCGFFMGLSSVQKQVFHLWYEQCKERYLSRVSDDDDLVREMQEAANWLSE